jgi:CCR4-NOT transcription complex subunit 6
VCSYNLLAERWTRDSQFDYVPKPLLDAADRTRRALRELDTYDPDVCALQEVQRDVVHGPLKDWMHRRGYSGAWVAKKRRLRGQARDAAAARATARAYGTGGSDDANSSSSGSSSDSGGGSDSGEPAEPDAETEPDEEGVALLWRDSLLERVDGASFRFADAAPASRLLSEFGDAAVVAVLRHRASGQELVAASVHLFWDPKLAHVKARQAALLARRCASLARRHARGGAEGKGSGRTAPLLLPVIIAGDWNSMPPQDLSAAAEEEQASSSTSQEAAVRRAEAAAAAATHQGSGVYRLLTTGTLPPSHPDHPAAAAAAAVAASTAADASEGDERQPASGGGRKRRRRRHRALSTRGLKLATVHAAAHGGREPQLTTRTATFSGALDHVFLGGVGGCGEGGGGGATWRVAATLEMPQLEGPIPDARWPSDHLAVGADLELLLPPVPPPPSG